MKDTTQVFGRIDQDLEVMNMHMKLLERFHNGFEMTELIVDSDRARLLHQVLKLEEEKKGMVSKIEDLKTSVAFLKANGRVNAMRIQTLEE